MAEHVLLCLYRIYIYKRCPQLAPQLKRDQGVFPARSTERRSKGEQAVLFMAPEL